MSIKRRRHILVQIEVDEFRIIVSILVANTSQQLKLYEFFPYQRQFSSFFIRFFQQCFCHQIEERTVAHVGIFAVYHLVLPEFCVLAIPDSLKKSFLVISTEHFWIKEIMKRKDTAVRKHIVQTVLKVIQIFVIISEYGYSMGTELCSYSKRISRGFITIS